MRNPGNAHSVIVGADRSSRGSSVVPIRGTICGLPPRTSARRLLAAATAPTITSTTTVTSSTPTTSTTANEDRTEIAAGIYQQQLNAYYYCHATI